MRTLKIIKAFNMVTRNKFRWKMFQDVQLKISKFQNEFMKSSFFSQKYEPKKGFLPCSVAQYRAE